MTTGPLTDGQPSTRPDDGGRDAVAVPLSLLLWALVVIALAYGIISTLDKASALFGG